MNSKTCGLMLATLLFAAGAYGQDALTIVRKVDENQRSDTTKQEQALLVYPSAHNDSDRREFSVLSYGRGNEYSYMEFISPRSIKGLKILSVKEDRWVFFPSTGRVRKIAGESKKQSVQGVGGDFSYEDMGGGTIEEKYNVRFLKEEAGSFLIEGTPKDKDSAYVRVVLYIDKNKYLATKIEYYTKDEGHYKDLLLSDFKVLGGRETATRLEMINIVKERKTAVLVRAVQRDIPIDEKYFKPDRFYK